MKKMIKISMTLCVLASSAYTEDNEVVKQAYDEGLNNAISVFRHEAKQAHDPVEQGYCISLKTTENTEPDDFSAIKLETLLLVYLDKKPSLLLTTGKNGEPERVLCASIKNSSARAKSVLNEMRDAYPKIDAFYPSIVHIIKPEEYKHIVPVVGEIHEDKSATIRELIKNSIDKEKKFKSIIFEKDAKIKELEEKIEHIASLIGGVVSAGSKLKKKELDKKQSSQEAKKTKITMPKPVTDDKKNIDKKSEHKKKERPKKDLSGINTSAFVGVKKIENKKYPIIPADKNTVRYYDPNEKVLIKMDKKHRRILKIGDAPVDISAYHPNSSKE